VGLLCAYNGARSHKCNAGSIPLVDFTNTIDFVDLFTNATGTQTRRAATAIPEGDTPQTVTVAVIDNGLFAPIIDVDVFSLVARASLDRLHAQPSWEMSAN
jgi:hypothetical protein